MPRKPPFKLEFENWLNQLDRDLRPETTISTYKSAVSRAYAFALEHGWPPNPRKIEPKHIRQYYQHLQSYPSKTQATYMAALFTFLKFCKNAQIMDIRLRIRPERGDVRWLSRDEVAILLTGIKDLRYQAAMTCFLYTGIRGDELVKLREKDVTKDWLLVQGGKGRKARKVPVDEEFWQMLQPYLEWKAEHGGHEFFLVHQKNRSKSSPLVPYAKAKSISQHLKVLGQRLGVERATSHPFRRTFGADLDEADCPLRFIQEYYGHKDPKTTEEYIGKKERKGAEAMRKYRPSYRSLMQSKGKT